MAANLPGIYRRYDGPFLNDMKCGKGVLISSNGNEYHGDFVDDMKNGVGTFFWTNGDTYEGEVHALLMDCAQ